MEGSDDVQDSTTAADMRTPVQETGDSATESSIIVGNANGINSSGLAGNGQLTYMQHTMEGSDDVQDSTTAANMRKPVQETGDGATESSIIVGNANGINSSGLAGNGQTFTQICASNAEIAELGMDETSSLYAEPSEEVGYNKLSALVTGVDPEVKVVYDIPN